MKKYYIFGILYLVAIVFIMNDTWLYTTPIAKLTKVETTREVEGKSTRGTAEKKYSQKMQGIILNGEKKGKTVHFSNEYTYLVMLLGILIFVLVEAAGRKGILTIITVGINIMIFAVFFLKADNTSNVVAICNKIVILFAIVTLVGLNGVNKKTWAALLSTLCVLVLIMGMFDLVIRHVQELDYSTMEYLGSIDNPDDMFHAEILLSGLGAIMDVAVAIAAALGEIVKQKPDVTFLELFKSGRKIGYDIMGTMINVLLFVFGSGLIPTFLIRMNNDIRFVTIVKLYIPCELCRFLVESIGIVWTIPVSIFITAIFMKLSVKKRRKS